LLETAEVLGPAQLHDVEAGQGARVPAASALDPEGRLEADEVGSRADVFCGHAARVTLKEQYGNKQGRGNRAKRAGSEARRLRWASSNKVS